MSKIIILILILFGAILFKCYKLFTYYPEITVPDETWWGDEDPGEEDVNIYPFKINVSQEILDDLDYRLAHTRPFTKPLLDNQVYGFNGDLAQEILEYWKNKYDWRKREKRMNKFPHFITNIQGLKIHFLQVKPKNIHQDIRVIPILLTHGWPSSFIGFLDIISILTTPQENRDFVFEVVFATIPGFGFSDPPQKPGFGAIEAAVVFKNLMNRLGYHQFYIYGEDMGLFITKFITELYPKTVLGVHTNMCLSLHSFSLLKYLLGSFYPQWMKRGENRELFYPISKFVGLMWTEFGYLHLQSTKPDTIGSALNDSPMGMAILYLEKFSTGANIHNRLKKDAGLNSTYDMDELLDNVMIYWITKSATTSFRFYAEIFNGHKFVLAMLTPIKIPCACVRGPYDIYTPDGMVEETFPNIVYSADTDLGHFHVFQNAKLVASEMYKGIDKIEEINGRKCCISELKSEL